MKLSEYVLKTREERTAHIDLTTECELGTLYGRSRGGNDKLYGLIGVEDDIENWTSERIHICHLCDCGRRKGECGNPYHIYIGTASENQYDLPAEFRHRRAKGAGRPKGGVNNEEKKAQFEVLSQSPEFVKLSSRKAAKVIGVSHFTIQRWRRTLHGRCPVEFTFIE